MIERKFRLETGTGLFARTASEFTRIAMRYDSEILLAKDGKIANCKSLLSVLAMGIRENMDFLIRIVGEDEQPALSALEDFFSNQEIF